MNSEKVKEIKKVLEQNTKTCLLYDFEKNTDCKVFQCKDILDYINELESENERLKTSEFNSCQELDNAFYQIHNLEDRIAELESELEKEQINNLNCDTELQYKEKRIAELEKEKEETMKAWFEDREGVFWDGVGEGELKGYKQLKRFAERLKEKAKNLKLGSVKVHNFLWVNDIDETLKDFINKGEQK